MEFDPGQAIAILERTPTVLHAMLGALDDAWTHVNEGPDTWSAYDIVGHLAHGERTDWMPRVHMILEHGRSKPFTPFDRFAQFHESEGKSLDILLDEFETERYENLAALRALQLTDEQLALEGEHPALGTVSLRQLLSTWVAHDLGHIAQVSRVMAKQYREAVGPWVAYLPVLTR